MVLFGTVWIRLSGSGHNRSRSRMWGLAGSYNTLRVRFHWTSTSLERCERFRHWEISRLGEWRTSQKCHIVSLEFIPKTLTTWQCSLFCSLFWCRMSSVLMSVFFCQVFRNDADDLEPSISCFRGSCVSHQVIWCTIHTQQVWNIFFTEVSIVRLPGGAPSDRIKLFNRAKSKKTKG